MHEVQEQSHPPKAEDVVQHGEASRGHFDLFLELCKTTVLLQKFSRKCLIIVFLPH